MDYHTNLKAPEGVLKLRRLVEEIDICLFCTNIHQDQGETCRPMAARQVDDEGNIWFISDVHSDKNKEIQRDKQVQLFFAHPGKSSYLVVNGDAEILVDRKKIDEVWTVFAKTWFKEGKDDPNISLLKVHTRNAYYWDTKGNKMINFVKMLASVATGANLVDAVEGQIKP